MTATVPLRHEIRQLIIDGAKRQPRTLQKRIGPSEVGGGCDRQIALKLAGAPRCNDGGDPLPSIVGTGAHDQLETFVRRANEALGRTRFLPEFPVIVREGLAGTSDLLDLDDKHVWDWKFPSTSRLAHYRSHGPSRVYRIQAHCYGRGARNAGFDINRVGIVFLPRGGMLKDAVEWSEPYDDQLVTDALDRLDDLQACADTFAEAPELIAELATDPDDCFFCPFRSATPTSPFQCAGANTKPDNFTRLSRLPAA